MVPLCSLWEGRNPLKAGDFDPNFPRYAKIYISSPRRLKMLFLAFPLAVPSLPCTAEPSPTMRAFSIFLMATILGLLSVVQGEDIPLAVKQYQETMDLWQLLTEEHSLPGSWFRPLAGKPSEAWLNFVKQHGEEYLKEGYVDSHDYGPTH